MKTINQSKRGKMKFWVFTALLLITSTGDIVCTYIGTPDLSNESNPLVYTVNFGWGTLIVSNVILVGLFILLYYYTFVRFKRSVIQCEGFKQYLSMLFFNRPDKFIWALYKFPKNKTGRSYLFTCLGFILAILVPIIRLRAVIEWIGIICKSEWVYSYFKLIKNIGFMTPLGRFDILFLGLILAIILLCYWFFKEYKINKKDLEENAAVVNT